MKADEPHPEVQVLLKTVESFGVLPLSQYSPEQAREITAQFRTAGAGPDVETDDRTVDPPGEGPEVPVRVYRPDADGPHPVVVYYHGGGFVIGDLESHDALCRHLTEAAGTVVVAVDYRLAPEHPFPAAVEDAYRALEWVTDDPEAVGGDGRVAVAGDSAGANLAAVVSLLARDHADGATPANEFGEADPADAPVVDHQLLVYPSVSPEDDWPSREENAEGYYLVEEDLQWFGECYLESELDAANPYAFPNRACDLSGLPPATVVTAGFDPLRDEGVAYADRLGEAGVAVTHRNYESMIHGFFSMLADPASLTVAHEAVETAAEDLRAALELD